MMAHPVPHYIWQKRMEWSEADAAAAASSPSTNLFSELSIKMKIRRENIWWLIRYTCIHSLARKWARNVRRLKVIRNFSVELKMFEECGLWSYLEFRYDHKYQDQQRKYFSYQSSFVSPHDGSESDKSERHEVCKFAT